MLDLDCYSHRKLIPYSNLNIQTNDNNSNNDLVDRKIIKLDDNHHHPQNIGNSEIIYESLADRVINYDSLQSNNGPFFSVEFFPPRTAAGATTLYRLIDKFLIGQPYFLDITWQVSGNPGSNVPTSSMTTADCVINYFPIDTMLHITCIGMKKDDLRRHLDRAKNCGIRNILALRGDKHENCDTFDFKYACDLVQFIREEYGQYFTIVVAGYPIPHPESSSPEHDLQCLKHKIDSGADFIITQMFFSIEQFVKFVENCRQIGIKCPIIPGICTIKNYESLLKICELSKIELPKELLKILEPIKQNVEAIRQFGIDYLTDLCRNLLQSKLSPGLHFYTLNDDTIIQVITNIGLWKNHQSLSLITMHLPWKRSANHKRSQEFIRPVHWANRSRSYIYRTKHWQEFPRKQWTILNSKNLKSSLDEDFYEFLDPPLNLYTRNELIKCQNLQDIYNLFTQYYSQYLDNIWYDNNNNNNNFDLSIQKTNETNQLQLPWIEKSSSNNHLFNQIFAQYGKYIPKGLLIINYLPKINGFNYQQDDDANTVIYQKEYIEFFINAIHLDKIKSLLKAFQTDNDDESDQVMIKFNIGGCLHDDNYKMKFTNWSQTVTNFITWKHATSHPIYIADQWTFDLWQKESFSLFDKFTKASIIKNNPYLLTLVEDIRQNFIFVSLIDNQLTTEDNNSSNTFQKIFDKIFDF